MNAPDKLRLIDEIKERIESLKDVVPTHDALSELSLRLSQLTVSLKNDANTEIELRRAISAAEAERAHFRDLFMALPDAYLLTDPLGSIQEANLTAEKMFHLRSGQYGDKALIVFVPPEERRPFGEILCELESGTDIVERDIWITPPGAPPFSAAVKVSAIRATDGRLQQLRWLFRDITRSQRAEEALYRAHDTLDQRLQDRTAELANLNDVLKEQIDVHMRVLDALRRSEHELADFFDNASVGLYCTGPDGIIIRCNQAELKTVGYNRDEYVGRHIADFHEDPQSAHELLRRLSNNEIVQNYEVRIRCKDGTIKHVLIDANVLWENGKFVYSRCFTRDITRRKRNQALLKESEERFKQVAENIREVFWLTDLQFKTFIYVSPAYEEIWGRGYDDLYSNPEHWIESIHPDDREIVQNKRKILQGSATAFEMEYRIHHPSGEIRWIRERVFPVRNENADVYRFAGISEDITARKQAEEERSRRLQEEAAHRAKDEFLATVAHELRTPLTAILGWTQLLSKKTLDEATASHAIGIIDRNTQLQAQLIEDLLDASRIASGRLSVNMRKTNMHQVIEAALDTVRLSAEHKCIQLTASLDPHVGTITGDPERLQQVVWNLLTNAIKFTQPGGTIDLTMEQNEDELEITVKDTGEGVSVEFLPHLFERFSQADNSSARKHRGLGLGLAIVRHIVELHSGSVNAYSAGLGRGTTLIIRLPMRLAADDPPVLQPDYPIKLSGELSSLLNCSVLLVDNDLDSRECIKHVLEHCGAKVCTALTAQEALNSLETFRPDVILSDLSLEGEDGYSFIQKVRSLEKEGSHIPAAALTGHTNADDKRRALASGFQMHLSKPIAPVQLAAAVASLRQLNLDEALR